MPDRSRFLGTTFGLVCIIAAAYSFTNGKSREGWLGIILGVGIILIWEWVIARYRS